MKKFLVAAICAVVLMISSLAQAAGESKLLADSAILVEAKTGRIIYEKNPDAEREPASMTKILTCVLAPDKLKLTEENSEATS